MKNKTKRVKKIKNVERCATIKNRIIVLLQQRTDICRLMLPELLGAPQPSINMALVGLRKAGIRIWPSKGPGTPLKIAVNELDHTKYVMWRRQKYLPTFKRMVITEKEIGEKYYRLAERPLELLNEINNNTENEVL